MRLHIVVSLICVVGLTVLTEGRAGGLAQKPPTGNTAAPPPALPLGMPPSPPIGPVSVEPGIDRPGEDYDHFAVPDADPKQCSAACETDHRCAAYTYVRPGLQGPDAICWLKASVPQPVQNECCISGKR
jgi:hypothetical protein